MNDVDKSISNSFSHCHAADCTADPQRWSALPAKSPATHMPCSQHVQTRNANALCCTLMHACAVRPAWMLP